MEFVVAIDERGRILIPGKIRKILGVKGKDRFLLRVRDDGVIELIPLGKMYSVVSKIFENKFKGWREESHEASKILKELVKS